MKLTAEQKAANAAARTSAKTANAEKLKKGGSEAMLATIENVKIGLDEQIETLGEGQESHADMLKDIKADLEKVSKGLKNRVSGKTTEGMDVEKFNLGKLALAYKSGRFDDSSEGVGYELECLVEAAKGFNRGNTNTKDMISSLTGGSGGNPLPVQVSSQIVEAARSESVLFQMGVQNDSLEGLSSFSVPYEVTSDMTTGNGVIVTPGNQQQGGAITTGRPGFKLTNFTPRRMGVIVGMTEDMLKQGGNFISAFVQRTVKTDMQNQLERNCLYGRGVEFSEPTGILNRTDLTASGINVGTDGRAIAFTDLKQFEFALAEANRLTDSCAYLTRPAVLQGLTNQTATYGLSGADNSNSMPITPMQFMSMKKLGEYCGYNLKWTTNVPKNYVQGSTTTASAVAFGDWSHVWIPFWGPMEFVMSNVATVGGTSAFENYAFWMRFVQMYDCNIVAPDAMSVKTGFITTGF